MTTITLEQLIEEGNEIKKQISYINPPSEVIRLYSAYRLNDNSKYEIWRNMSIRYLSVNFPEDRCINDFEETSKEFSKTHNSPIVFDRMIAILQSCLAFPQISSEPKKSNQIDKSIHVNVHQTQTQSQQQSMAIDIFLEAINDELTGKQLKEIKEIMVNEPKPIQAKTKLIDKIKSFGSDVASNIIANIITNPTIWGNF